jgi:7-keto-8-aminopelargonate synthetase-like enzyme
MFCAQVHYFPHNDMKALAQMLEQHGMLCVCCWRSGDGHVVRQKTKRSQQNAEISNRRRIVSDRVSAHWRHQFENRYANFGDIAPLPELVALKNKHCLYLVVDEVSDVRRS